MTRRTRLGTLVVLLGAAWAAAATIAPDAWAHAGLVSSDPAANAVLATSPSTITLSFTEPPDTSLSTISVLDASGAAVPTAPAAAGSDAKQLVATVGGTLPKGSYTVSWRVISQTDGHVTAGSFAFGVGEKPRPPKPGGPAPPTTPPPSAASVVGKLLLYAGLALVVGTTATGLYAFGGHVPARRRLLTWAGATALLGAVVMTVAERSTVGVPYGQLLRSSAGRPYLWLVVGATATAVACFVASRDAARRSLAVAGAIAAATMFVRAEGGHAAGTTFAWIQVVVQWLHFVAAGVWVGGFVPVLLLLREPTRTPAPSRPGAVTANGDGTGPTAGLASESPLPDRIAAVMRYSAMAGWSLLVVALTGAVRAVSELGGFGKTLHVLSTSYGLALALKVGVALVLIALGAANRLRSIPRMAGGGGAKALRTVLSFEGAAAIGVLTLTGVLTGLAPNPPPPPEPAGPPKIVATGSDFATTMKVSLTIAPGTAGPNRFRTEVTDYDSGAPFEATSVALRFTPVGRPGVAPSQLELRSAGAGVWTGTGGNLSLAGAWGVDVQVQSAQTGTEVPLYVSTTPADQTITVSAQAGEPTLYTLAFPSGKQMQAYVDPGKRGSNQFHLTAFDAKGQEYPLSSVLIVATPPEGTPAAVDTRRFGPGHFVGSIELTDGAWHFDVQAAAKDGSALAGSFDQTFG
jgi:copper transport protein